MASTAGGAARKALTGKYGGVTGGKGVLPFFLANKPVASSAQTLPVIDKFTNQVAFEVAMPTVDDVETAIAEGVKAEGAMKRMTAFARKDVLLGVAKELESRSEELAYVLCIEAGKPMRDAKAEVGRAIDTFTVSAEEAVRQRGEYVPYDISSRNAGLRGLHQRFPVGLVSLIAPFNFPLNLVAHKVAPAIAAGCPFVLKPSERTPRSALIIGECLAKAELPPGAFSILPCDTEAAGKLSKDDRIKVLSFTGSERVGWHLYSNSGRKRVVLELGGNAGCIVDETATKETIDHIAKRLAFGAFYYSGQSCISVQRIYAHEAIYDDLRSRLIKEAEAMTATKGDPMEAATALGPVITENDAKRLESWVNESVSQGAKLLAGGKRDGSFFDATLVEHVPNMAKLSCEEAFGPVAGLEKFTDFKEVIKRMNDSRFGLQAGVFTTDFNRAFYAYDNLEVGGVVINDVPATRVDSQPYGGVKASGVGREGPQYAIEDFTELKVMLIRDAARL